MSAEETEPPGAVLLSRKVVSIDRESCEGAVSYVARPDFTNRHGTIQGGFLAAMLDSATGVTLVGCLNIDETAVTQSLTIEFLRPAKPGALLARTKVISRSGATAEVTGELVDENGVKVATAIAVLRVRKPQSSR
jgi:uncharacterized protein (TIGR00369 family)